MEDQRTYLENEKDLQEDTSIAVKVNNIPIYQSQIEIKMIQNNRALENYLVQLDAMSLSEQEKTSFLETYTATLLLNKRVIMNEWIRNVVIQMEAGKRGLIPADGEVMTKAQEHFTNIKKTPGIYASARLHMEVMNLSEEDFLRLIINECKKTTGQANLYQQITEGFEIEEKKSMLSMVPWMNGLIRQIF